MIRADLIRRLYSRLILPVRIIAAHRRGLQKKFAQPTLDRAQWHRWYKVNRRFQRQMRGLKLATGTGRPIDPRTSSLPRWAVQ